MSEPPRAWRGPTAGARGELAFWEYAKAQGWEVHFRGWPDFLVLADGKWVCVEVKTASATLQSNQSAMIEALRRAGIETLVWRPGKGFYRPRLPGRKTSGGSLPQNSQEANGR